MMENVSPVTGGRAILLLDFIDSLLAPGGPVPADDPRVALVLKAAARTLDNARRSGELVLAAGSEAPAPAHWINVFRRRPPAADGSRANWTTVLPLDGVAYFSKSSASAFVNPRLDPWLRKEGVDTLAICGLTARTSVTATAVSAMALGYKVELVCDAIAGRSVASRHWSLAKLLAKGARIVRSPSPAKGADMDADASVD